MKEETLNKLKKEVLKILKRGQKSITEIAAILGRNHYATLEVLNSLEAERKVEKVIFKKFTLYELK